MSMEKRDRPLSSHFTAPKTGQLPFHIENPNLFKTKQAFKDCREEELVQMLSGKGDQLGNNLGNPGEKPRLLTVRKPVHSQADFLLG